MYSSYIFIYTLSELKFLGSEKCLHFSFIFLLRNHVPDSLYCQKKMLASERFKRSPCTDHVSDSPSFNIPTVNKIYSKLIKKVKTGGGENLSSHSKRERRQADEEEKKTREGLVAWEMVILVKGTSADFITMTKRTEWEWE